MQNFFQTNTDTLLQFLLCAVAGGFATLLDMGVLYIMVKEFHIYYLIAAASGFAFGAAANYIMNILWVFKSSGNKRSEFALFMVVAISGLVWTEAIMWLLVDKAQTPVLLSKALAAILVLLWNFWMRKKFVFANPKAKTLMVPGAFKS